MRRMEEVLAIVERFQQMSRSSSPTLVDCKMLFQQLRDDYAPEFQLFGLDTIALTNVLPMVSCTSSNQIVVHVVFSSNRTSPRGIHWIRSRWIAAMIFSRSGKTSLKSTGMQCLRRPTKVTDPVFKFATPYIYSDSLSAFDRCVWEAWMPPIRRAALAWNAKTNGPQMINVVETWISPRRAANPRVPDRPPLLPGWIIENLLEQVTALSIAYLQQRHAFRSFFRASRNRWNCGIR